MLKWVYKNGCKWDKNTCIAAAYNGFLDVFVWARKHGCGKEAGPEFHLQCVLTAVSGGHAAMIQALNVA